MRVKNNKPSPSHQHSYKWYRWYRPFPNGWFMTLFHLHYWSCVHQLSDSALGTTKLIFAKTLLLKDPHCNCYNLCFFSENRVFFPETCCMFINPHSMISLCVGFTPQLLLYTPLPLWPTSPSQGCWVSFSTSPETENQFPCPDHISLDPLGPPRGPLGTPGDLPARNPCLPKRHVRCFRPATVAWHGLT